MTTAARPLLTVRGLAVRYPATTGATAAEAVHGVSFTVATGEVVGLVGASGCGKSSILGAVAGLLAAGTRVTADELTLDGHDLTALDRRGWRRLRRTHLGLVPQQPMTALTPTVAVGRQLDWYLGAGAVERHADRLRDLGLASVVDRPDDLPSRFSGGQLQRLLIAVNTLERHPVLLLADEPTSTLDVTVQAAILDHLRDLRSSSNTAMVLVSHDLAVIAHNADRVGVVHRGELVELAPVSELFESPTHPVTRALVAAVPRRPAAPRPTADLPATPRAAPPAEPEPEAEAEPDVEPAYRSADGPADRPAPLLQVDRVYHYYGRAGTGARSRGPAGRVVRAVDEVSLQVAEGEAVAVVGESGSGKTTLARVVVGALEPTAGTVRLAGRDLDGTRHLDDRRHVQLVSQNPRTALNPRRRVGHGLDQAQRVHRLGTDRADRVRRAREVCALVHLAPELLDRRPAELSGGELARVVLARSLLLEPKLLILDEPTASLDATVKAAVLDVLGEVRARLGLALLVITHELATARALADRVVVMHQGRVVECGPTSVVLTEPDHTHTRALVASELTL